MRDLFSRPVSFGEMLAFVMIFHVLTGIIEKWMN